MGSGQKWPGRPALRITLSAATCAPRPAGTLWDPVAIPSALSPCLPPTTETRENKRTNEQTGISVQACLAAGGGHVPQFSPKRHERKWWPLSLESFCFFTKGTGGGEESAGIALPSLWPRAPGADTALLQPEHQAHGPWTMEWDVTVCSLHILFITSEK